jgi:hypothetical protein
VGPYPARKYTIATSKTFKGLLGKWYRSCRFGVSAMEVRERTSPNGRRKTGTGELSCFNAYSRCLWSNIFRSGSWTRKIMQHSCIGSEVNLYVSNATPSPAARDSVLSFSGRSRSLA